MRQVAKTVLADTGEIKIKVDALLKKAGITRTKLANLMDVDYRVVRNLLNGTTKRVDMELWCRICYVLQCDLSDIMEYIPPPKD